MLTWLLLSGGALAADPLPQLRHTTLDNGLQVVTQVDRRLPLVEVTLAVAGGSIPRSAAERRQERTVAEAAPEQWLTLRRAGAQRGSWIVGPVSGFRQTVGSADVAAALELASHQLRATATSTPPRTPAAPLLATLATSRPPATPPATPPAAAASKAPPLPLRLQLERAVLASALLYNGPERSVSSATRWAPNNAVLVVVGDFQPHEVDRLIAARFGGLARVAQPTAAPTTAVAQTSRRHGSMRSPQVPHAMLLYGWSVAGVGQAQRPLVDLLRQLLPAQLDGVGVALAADGRAFAAVTAQRSYRPTQDVLWLTIATPEVRPYAVARLVEQQVARLGLRGPTAAQLTAAKKQAARALAARLDDPAQRAQALAWHALMDGDPRAWLRDHARLQGTTGAQVRAFARRWLLPMRASAIEVRTARPQPTAAAANDSDGDGDNDNDSDNDSDSDNDNDNDGDNDNDSDSDSDGDGDGDAAGGQP